MKTEAEDYVVTITPAQPLLDNTTMTEQDARLTKNVAYGTAHIWSSGIMPHLCSTDQMQHVMRTNRPNSRPTDQSKQSGKLTQIMWESGMKQGHG
jgi:hypothetical protein